MNASFIFRSIRRLFGRPTRDATPAHAAAQPVAPRPVVAMEPLSVEPVQTPVRKMRTLDEVRADLARLRLSASERHARSHAWRDTNFAPTDFMDLANN